MQRSFKSGLFFLLALLALVRAGQAAYVDNGDTITDTVTGLEWQKATAPGTYTWQAAQAYCEGLTLNGHSDWRLPDRNELRSLVDYSRYSPAIDPVFAATTVSSCYWSSTTYARDTALACVVDFLKGSDTQGYKSGGYIAYFAARAVRGGLCGGIDKPTISDNGDDTYTITVTLAEPLPDNTYVAINFDNQQGGWLAQIDEGGHIPATCSGTTCTAVRHLDYPGIRYFRAGIFAQTTPGVIDATTDVLQCSYSQSSTCTEQSCIDAVIKKNEIGDPAQSGSGSQLLRGVDVATGNFHQSATDLSVSGKGPDFTLTRAYNSRGGASRSGKWSFNLDAVVRLDAFNIMTIEYREDGRLQHFYKEMDGKWYPLNPGNFDELVRQPDGTVTLYTKGNLLYRFADPAGSSAGRLERIEDRDTNALVFSHTSNRITGATDASGRSYTITRDGSGRINGASDFAGRSVIYTWNSDNMIVTATNPRSNSTTYGYSGTRMTTITDPRTNLQATIEYYTALADDDFGLVKSVTDGLGNAWEYIYGIDNVYSDNLPSTGVTRPAVNGVNNNIIFHVDTARTRVLDRIDSIDAGDYRSTNSFRAVTSNKRIAEMALVERRVKPSLAGTDMQYSDDGKGNRTRTTDAASRVTGMGYAAVAGQTNLNPLINLTKPGVANPTLFSEFTDSGKAKRVEDPLNNVTTRLYETGLLTQSTDARGNSTGVAYDANGRPTHVTDALGHVTITTYDALGRVSTQQNARGFTTTTTYDANGNVLTTTNPAGGVTINTYDVSDNLITTTDPRGNTTTYVYDTLNRKIEEQYTVGGQQRVRGFAYDAMGRLYRQTNEKGYTSESRFNARGTVLQEIDPMSETITYTYDPNGNMLTQTDAEGRVLTYAYDTLDRKKKVTDALGNYEEFTYNTQGLLATKRDGRGKVTSYEYDGLGHMTKVTDADGGITSATYDANGNLATTVDRKSQTTTYTYDALNRLTLLTDAVNRQWSFSYDANGNMLTRTMPSGQTITYTYDNLDRVSGVSYPGGPTVGYTYDANGNRLTMTDAVGTTTSTYDERNQLTGVTNAFGLAVGYGYDAAGLLQQLTYPGNKVVNYVHDASGRLSSLTDWLDQTTTYTRDGSGMVRGIQYGNGAKVEKDYDAVGRLVSLINRNASNAVIASHTLTLDGAGNPAGAAMNLPILPDNVGKTAEMIYDASNRLTSVDGTAITLDTNGRMTGDPSGIDPIQYAYNAQDLITTVTKDGALTDTYTYDGDGRRVARVSGGQTTRYLLDPTGGDLYRVLAETDGSNAVQRYYVYGDGLVSQISGTEHHYYHFDPSGNTLALTGNSGALTDSYAYEPFGNTTVQGSTANPFRFVGQHGVMDDGNGLHHMRARYYRPDLRRFVSMDALYGEMLTPQSLNRYAYALGNPVMGVDPSGKVVKLCNRVLGSTESKDTMGSFYNPFRHDYIAVNDMTISFQRQEQSGLNSFLTFITLHGLFTSYGKVELNTEKVDRATCTTIWSDNSRDKFVLDALSEKLYTNTIYGIGPIGTDCQEYAAEVLDRAEEMYNEDFYDQLAERREQQRMIEEGIIILE